MPTRHTGGPGDTFADDALFILALPLYALAYLLALTGVAVAYSAYLLRVLFSRLTRAW